MNKVQSKSAIFVGSSKTSIFSWFIVAIFLENFAFEIQNIKFPVYKPTARLTSKKRLWQFIKISMHKVSHALGHRSG